MRLIKSALCILVIFALAVSLVPTTASASALSVVGTSFSSAGLTSAEFAASAGPYAIGILAALAAAYGIKTFTQSDTGQAVKEFFTDLIEERAAETRRSVAEEMEILLGNATIGEQGNIVLGRLSYAEAKEILLRDNIPVDRPEPISSIMLKDFTFGNSLNYICYSINEPSRQCVAYIESKSSPYNNMYAQAKPYNTTKWDGFIFVLPPGAFANGDLHGYIEDIQTGNIVQTYTLSYRPGNDIAIGNQYYNAVGFGAFYRCDYAPEVDGVLLLEQTYTLDDLRIDYEKDTLYGVDETLRNQTVGLNEGLTLAPDLINGAVIEGASGEISASDYCGALVDYVSGYDTVIDGVTVTGLPAAGTVPRTIEEAPTSDTVIDEAPPSTMTGTEAAGLYTFSLDELFPFCLPFDFVKIVEKFNVEPEAPNFDWRFYIPGVIDYTLHIDLSAWNTAAEVCRTMVLIAFMVGLIMLTRQIFIRA